MHRLTLLALALSALFAPALASAQTTGGLPSGWFVSRVGPHGGAAPRAFENSGAVPGPGQTNGTAGAVIGLRDCECGEQWVISGPLDQTTGSSQYELWIGNSATACQTYAQRSGVSGTPQTCRQLQSAQNVTPTFNVTIPSARLVNPVSGVCAADDTVLHAGASTGQLYFAVVFTNPNNDATATPGFTFGYDYLSPTPTPSSVSASPEEGAALVTWAYTGSTSTTTTTTGDGSTTTVDDSGTIVTVDDGGTVQIQASLIYYILSWPPPATAPTVFQFDASPCEGSVDVAEEDATDESDVAPIDDLATTDASGDAGVDDAEAGFTDAGVDASVDASADASDVATDAAPMCGSPPLIDPDNDYEFKQLVASQQITPGIGGLTFTVPNLTNGVPYQFAVVVQDSAGNRTMSAWSTCVTPQPVTDLWQQYENRRGSAASPSFCSVRAPGAIASWGGSGGLAVLGCAATALVVRRRRRAKRPLVERGPQ